MRTTHHHGRGWRRLMLAAIAAAGALAVAAGVIEWLPWRGMVPLAEQRREREEDFAILSRMPRLAAIGAGGGKLYEGPGDRRVIALTFDDGPHPRMVPRLLGILAREHVRATFFVVGRSALAHPELIRAEVAGGHEVSNHTFHHARLNRVAPDLAEPEIAACDAVVAGITGRPADRYFRPPGGEVSPSVVAACRDLGKTLVMFSDDPEDYRNIGEKRLLARLLAHAKPGGIILLHDNVRQTLHILPELILRLKAAGYQFVTVAQLDALRQPKPAPLHTAQRPLRHA